LFRNNFLIGKELRRLQIASNGNIKLVKDEGGWKTYKMVERYAKYNERHLQKQSEVIGSYLARAKA